MDDANRDRSAPTDDRGSFPEGLEMANATPSAQPRSFPPAVATLFVGPNGIRAGWRLLLFLIIAFLCGFALRRLLPLLGLRAGGEFRPPVVLVGEGLSFAVVLFAAAVMGRIEKRSLADYALPRKGAFGAGFWQGVVWGFVSLTALLLMILAGHGFSFGRVALGGTELITYAALWAVVFLLVGLFEEFLMRGYALYTLSSGMGFWPSAFLLSAIFGGVHLRNPGEAWAGGLSAALIGVFFCLTVRRTGSLWFAIGFHAMWDYSESFLYSVPDSGVMVPGHLLNSSFHGPKWLTGGSVGPEGSTLVFGVIAVLFIVFDRVHRDVRFPLVPKPHADTSEASKLSPPGVNV